MSKSAQLVIFFLTVFFSLAIVVPKVIFAQTDPNPEANPAAQQQAQPSGAPQGQQDATGQQIQEGLKKKLESTGIFEQGTQQPVEPSSSIWDAFYQTTFTGNTIVNWVSCFGVGLPFGGSGCAQTIFKPKQTENGMILEPKTMITFNGEGGGALGAATGMIASTYKNPPASGVSYLARAIDTKFGLEPKSAYAQVGGSGAAVLSPVEGLWQLSRNISYLFFIFVFIGMGIMIMFRQKLNPQTVITVQSALPGVVVGLILVTFSYFIAGLIVDIAFWGSNVVGVLILSQVQPASSDLTSQVRYMLDNQGLFSMFGSIIFDGRLWDAAGGLGQGVTSVIDSQVMNSTILGIILGGALACFNPIGLAAIGASFGLGFAGCAAIGAGVGGGLAGTGLLISGLIYLVLLVGLIQAMVRLLFAIINAYVQIIVFTILGPIMILFGSFPGNGEAISGWWRPLLANTLIFPAIFAVFLLANVLLQVGATHNGTPPATLPLFGGSLAGFVPSLLTYGLILAAPALPAFIRDSLKAKTNGIFQQQVGKNIGVGQKAVGIVGGTLGYTALYRGGGGMLQAAMEHGGGFWRDWSRGLRRKGFGN